MLTLRKKKTNYKNVTATFNTVENFLNLFIIEWEIKHSAALCSTLQHSAALCRTLEHRVVKHHYAMPVTQWLIFQLQVHAAMTMIALITLHVEKMKSVYIHPVQIVRQMLIVLEIII